MCLSDQEPNTVGSLKDSKKPFVGTKQAQNAYVKITVTLRSKNELFERLLLINQEVH